MEPSANSLPPPSSEETKPPRWLEWVEKNSQPKRYISPRPKLERTPWQKRGPMKRRDWIRFYKWASKKAVPRPLLEPPPLPEPLDIKGRPKKKYTLDEVMERMEQISEPRHTREKYVAPPKQTQFPFIPQIDPTMKPKREHGRPFKVPVIPKFFYHISHEIDFWCDLKFPPLPRAALEYVATPNILKLAKPRKRPPDEHCPIPKETIPSRVRMSHRKWIEHKRRLEYLAKPQIRPAPRDECTPAEFAKGLEYIPFYKSPGKWKYRNFKYVKGVRVLHKRPGTKHCFCTLPFASRAGGSMTYDQWRKHRKRLDVLASPALRPPPKEHCPIPSAIRKRKVMTKEQWANHQTRLEKLAKPVTRTTTHTREEPKRGTEVKPKKGAKKGGAKKGSKKGAKKAGEKTKN